MAKKQSYIYAVGRRKTASARVRLFKGKGENIVNGQPIEKYFEGKIDRVVWTMPFDLTETTGKYYLTAKVVGSGKKAQLEALVHGLSRAFVKTDKEKFGLVIKQAGLLTRDSRERQRRMVGTGGKSRRKKQSPKR